MILTCPKCSTRYILPAPMLGDDGHKVKCSSCEEIWHQVPELETDAEEGEVFEVSDEVVEDDSEKDSEGDDEPAEDSADEKESDEAVETPDDEVDTDEEEVVPVPDDEKVDEQFEKIMEGIDEDIPEGVKPKPGSDALPDVPDEESKKKKRLGYISAFFVFCVIAAGLVLARGSFVQVWPPAQVLYSMVGLSTSVPGEGLVFDRLSVKVQRDDHGKPVFVISGHIINLTQEDKVVPVIRASLRGEAEKALDSVLIEPPEKTLGAESDTSFEGLYHVDDAHDISGEVVDVNVRFTLSRRGAKVAPAAHDEDGGDHDSGDHGSDDHGAKIASEGDDNTHAPH